MKEIKSLFDKIELDETKSDAIRSKLVSKRSASHAWLIPVVAVAAAMIMIMVIPVTRNKVVYAAERILELFHIDIANGDVLEYEVNSDTGETYSLMYLSSEQKTELVRIKDGRLYLVLGEEWTDITDKCSATEYYRHEITLENGVKEVILVGGVPEPHKYGWIIFVDNLEGNSGKGQYSVSYQSSELYPDREEEDFEWVKKAAQAEGRDFYGHDRTIDVEFRSE